MHACICDAPLRVPRVQHHQLRSRSVPVVNVEEQVAVVLFPRAGPGAWDKDGFGGETPLGKRGRVRLEAAAGRQVDLVGKILKGETSAG